MEIAAMAYLQYWNGESLSCGAERLELVVKFRESGNILKTKKTKVLASTASLRMKVAPYTTYNEYFEYVKKYLSDTKLIQEEAEKLIMSHFNTKSREETKYQAKINIHKKIKEIGKIEVKVTVK